jgi:AbrB family looped-hinge helix DNA binding protein
MTGHPELMASDLWPEIERRRLELIPLRGQALRAAIEQPARHAGDAEEWKQMAEDKEFVATITSKGQVTIPIEIREQLGLAARDKVIFRIDFEHNLSVLGARAKDWAEVQEGVAVLLFAMVFRKPPLHTL